MDNSLETLTKLYEKQEKEALEEFCTFLRFPSISTDPSYRPDVRACAAWVIDKLKALGFTIDIWETGGHPIIFATFLNAGPEQPTLLLYNHYDVQPVDPLELWKHPPFEPHIENGEVYARGAQDNKGQCFYVLQALKLLIERNGTLPINIKLCIEGEEEVGSPSLSKILPEKQSELQADYLAIVDAGIEHPNEPAVSLGIRGIVTMDVTCTGSSTDLHSGSHGGIAYNPIHALVHLLSSLRDETGRITIPGFYDAVKKLSDEEKAMVDFAFNEEEYHQMFGGSPSGGERQFPPKERAWTRPTLEVNGITGGYTGEGFKTVIPAMASAKLSCRLVPNQDPHDIAKRVADHLESHAPGGLKIQVKVHSGIGSPLRTDPTEPIIQAFSRAYAEVFGKETSYILGGGSIPITSELQKCSGASVVIMGLGLPGDQIHAPNEHFGINRLKKGALIIARTIEQLAREST